jgi:hypothetical protein
MYAPYQKGMESIHYGDDAKNRVTKSALSSGQALMMGVITNLIRGSQEEYKDALKWYKPYVEFQKTRPQ